MNWFLSRLCAVVCLSLLVSGLVSCAVGSSLEVNRASGYYMSYNQVAPFKYEETHDPYVFYYGDANLRSVYDLFFHDILIIGKSVFTGRPERVENLEAMGRSVGADVIIYSRRPTESLAVQESRRYMKLDHVAYFLKNVGSDAPLWSRRKDYYVAAGASGFDGLWKNEAHSLLVFTSSDLVVGVLNVEAEPEDPDCGGFLGSMSKAYMRSVCEKDDSDMQWSNGDLKFVFNSESGMGAYISEGRMPESALFSINRFGHLEVNLSGRDFQFSFARVEDIL